MTNALGIVNAVDVSITRTEHAMPHPDVDWKKAPKLARWWAIDADGQAHWFCAPNVAAFTNFWFSEPQDAPTFGYDGDYRQSLTERPPAGERKR